MATNQPLATNQPGLATKTTYTDGVQERIAAMNKQTIANASPVARQAETLRQDGSITNQQSEAAKAASFNLNDKTQQARPLVVSTSQEARNDLANKQSSVNSLADAIGAQSSANGKNAQSGGLSLSTDEGFSPPSADDIADSLAKRYSSDTSADAGTGGSAVDLLAKTTADSVKAQKDAYDQWSSSISDLKNGLIPLTSEQQGQVDAINSAASRAIAQQQVANKNFVGGVTQAGIRSGMSRYSPEAAFGEVQQATSDGIAKINDIENKAVEAVATLKKGFRDENYDLINKTYDNLTKLMDDKQKAITDLAKTVQDHEDKTRQYNLDVQKQQADQAQDEVVNNLNSDKFTYQQKQDAIGNVLSSDKFTWQQKMDTLDKALASDKFSYEQKHDLITDGLNQDKFDYEQQKDVADREASLEKSQASDTPTSYKEWQLAGQPGTYAAWLKEKSTKAPTANQSAAATYAINMKQANDTIESLQKFFTDKTVVGQALTNNLPSWVLGGDSQQLRQAENNFLLAVLRRQSGANITDSEFAREAERYFPQANDGPKVLADKAQNRRTAIEGLMNEAGPAISDDFLSAVSSGKRNYTSIDDVLTDHPEEADKIEKALNEGEDPEKLMQFYSDGPADKSAFSTPLSMGRNGSEDRVAKFASAIAQHETGNRNVAGATGELATRYQFMPATWKKLAGKYLGDAGASTTDANQDKVAKAYISDLFKQGYDERQVAMIWNGGTPNRKVGTTKTTSGKTIKYDTGKYADSVLAIYNA